jgi:type IV pilus assembly protein PilN
MVRINLLPIRTILRKRELKDFGIRAGAILVAVVAVIGVVYYMYSSNIAQLQAKQRNLKAELAKLKKQNEEINKLEKEIADLKTQVKTIKKLTSERDTPAPFMAALALAIPDEVWLRTIDKTKNSFSLDGYGVDNTVVVDFVRNLQQIRKDFSLDQPYIADDSEERFFTGAKLVSIVSEKSAGSGAMGFKIVGSVR